MKDKQYPYQDLSLKNIKGEEWEDIPGLDGYFLVSNLGRIKRLRYETQYKNGAIYVKPEKIIKPGIVKAYNHFKNDYSLFLTARLTFERKRHNFSIARLVYYCFKQKFALDDHNTVIMTKDYDNLNIRPSNLIATTPNYRSKRIFDRKRAISPLLTLPESFKKKQREAIARQMSKIVTQYSKTGRKIKTFPSMVAAERATGIFASSIGSAASGKNISAGGFIWRWGSAKKTDAKTMIAARREHRKRKHREKYGYRVTQYDLKGNRVAFYTSLSDAEEATGISGTAISRVTKGTYKSAKGFFWKEGYGKTRIDLSGHLWGNAAKIAAHLKKVKQYSLHGKYTRTFNSLKEAAMSVGVKPSTLSACCGGAQKSCGGYKWKFTQAK